MLDQFLSAASRGSRRKRRCPSCSSSTRSTASAAPPTSRTTSPRSAAASTLVGLVGGRGGDACARARRAGIGVAGLVEDRAAPTTRRCASSRIGISRWRAWTTSATRKRGDVEAALDRARESPRAGARVGDRRVGLSERGDDATAGRMRSSLSRTSAGFPCWSIPRSRTSTTTATPLSSPRTTTRRRRRRTCGFARTQTRPGGRAFRDRARMQGGADHARRARHVAARRRRRRRAAAPPHAKSRTSPAPATR